MRASVCWRLTQRNTGSGEVFHGVIRDENLSIHTCHTAPEEGLSRRVSQSGPGGNIRVAAQTLGTPPQQAAAEARWLVSWP